MRNTLLSLGAIALTGLALTHRGIAATAGLALNDLEYLEMPGLNVMLAHDYYPEGHQGGVGIILNGQRLATNGDVRLDRTPGQWQPVPKAGPRRVDRATQEIRVRMEYPDPARNRTGFNPIEYPDINFAYTIRVRPEGAAFRIIVDLEQPLPAEFVGRIGFNLELLPGLLFGRTWAMDETVGIFPRQPDGPGVMDAAREYQIAALATGRKLVVAPESDALRLAIENSLAGGTLELVDGRGQHDNGWFIVRSLLPAATTSGAVNWLVTPHAIPGFTSAPVVQVSQVGYHPRQAKTAIVELDARDTTRHSITLARVQPDGGFATVLEAPGHEWGRFLRHHYLQLDFTSVTEPSMYIVRYGDAQSEPFKIGADVFQRHVWQPTLEYFLPSQMCHVRVNDRYRVWHDVCHLDDARMAPLDHNHFDGYAQGSATLTTFQPGAPVPGLAVGGWHDAGDDDLRVESQSGTIGGLALAWEEFRPAHDNTTIDQAHRVVEVHRPDGKPDLLQQIEHGALSIVGGYQSLGRLYRGIITPTLRQYVLLGDPSAVTDNVVFDPAAPDAASAPPIGTGVSGAPDDRWVFTEDNPKRELLVAGDLAAAARALRGFNDALADECLRIAQELWDRTRGAEAVWRVPAAAELLRTTRDRRYAAFFQEQRDAIAAAFARENPGGRAPRIGWYVARAVPLVDDPAFAAAMADAARACRARGADVEKGTPYGVAYTPDIWGAGWTIQGFGAEAYYLHRAWPDVFPATTVFNALNFVLGCHPGPNNASFVSGVGAKSVTTAYGFNRADWSHIPGGSVSGTALIRPDFPELLEWPYLWQQTEYVLGGGTTDYLFLVLAADHLLQEP